MTKAEAKTLAQVMKAELAVLMNSYNALSEKYKNEKAPSTKEVMDELAVKIRKYKAAYQGLSTDCITDGTGEVVIESPIKSVLEMSELDSDYEEVIESNLKMRTGPSPNILEENKTALEKFIRHYEAADEGQQKKWKKAMNNWQYSKRKKATLPQR